MTTRFGAKPLRLLRQLRILWPNMRMRDVDSRAFTGAAKRYALAIIPGEGYKREHIMLVSYFAMQHTERVAIVQQAMAFESQGFVLPRA